MNPLKPCNNSENKRRKTEKLPYFERRKTFANPINLGVTGCKVK